MEKIEAEKLQKEISILEDRIQILKSTIEIQRRIIELMEQNETDTPKHSTPKAEKCIYKVLIPKNR